MRKLLAAIPLTLAMTCAFARGKTYTEGKPVILSGKVIMAEAPDPLDESATPKQIRFPALEITQPFDLACESPESGKPYTVRSSRQVQLGARNDGQYERIKARIGKTVNIRCDLGPAMTAHHYTPVLCFVNDVRI